MKQILSYFICAYLFLSLAKATVINVPDDYASIQSGIQAANIGDTVLVQPGVYYENLDFIGKSITLASRYQITGDTSFIYSTIIDGNDSGSVVIFQSGEDSLAILTGFTIRNGKAEYGGGIYCNSSSPTIVGNFITSNDASRLLGGGIYCQNSDALIANNRISFNSAYTGGGGISCSSHRTRIIGNIIDSNAAGWFQDGYGGGIYLYNSTDILIQNNLIINNYVCGDYWSDGGGICAMYSWAYLINNTIVDNRSCWETAGGFAGLQQATIVNCIIRDNSPYDIYGEDNCVYSNIGRDFPGDGNINVDPLFRDPENSDYHLMAIACGDSLDSPCIDAGNPDMPDSIIDCDWGMGELRSDMGAYGGGYAMIVSIDDVSNLPHSYNIITNYPNPFNHITTIRYGLNASSHVSLEIYDVLGRKLETLIDGEHQAGHYKVSWDASEYPSGMYFAKLITAQSTSIEKMIFLK